MPQALISYTGIDRPKADKLREALTAAGVDVWWDQKLIPGSTFPREIADAIDASPCTLVLCSSAAMRSRWVLAEANYAGTRVIPIIAEADVKLIPPLNVVEGAQLLDWDKSPPGPEFDLLLQKIQGAIAAGVAKQSTPPSDFQQICRREHIRSWGRLLHEELEDRWFETGVTSPLYQEADKFFADQLWHEWVRHRLQDAKSYAESDLELVDLLADIKSVDCSAEYPAILAGLRKLSSEKNERSVTLRLARVKSSIDELKKREDDPNRSATDNNEITQTKVELQRERRRLESLQEQLWALRDEARDPEFRRALLVSGFPGSGRTHLVASILDGATNAELHPDPGALIVVLEHPAQPTLSIDQLLLDQVRRATQHDWISLEEFDEFLEHTYDGTRVVFVMDNLEQWQARRSGFSDLLADWIYQSKHRSFRWVITLNSGRYDDVSRSAERWRQLAWRRSWDEDEECPNLSGWLDLDSANREKMTGLRIIQEQLTEQPLALDYLNNAELDETVRRNLASPLLAWLILELRDKLALPLDQAISLNFVEFIEEFQKLRINLLCKQYRDLAPRQFEQAIWLIAELLAKTGELRPFVNEILDYFAAKAAEGFELAKVDVAEEVLAGLCDVNLLVLLVDRDQGSRRRFEPRFESFWQFHLAKQIAGWKEVKQRRVDEFVDLLETWFEVAQASVISAEGVLEYLLLQISNNLRGTDRLDQFQAALWISPFSAGKIPSAAPWFAGPKAPVQAQQVIADWASHGGVVRKSRRDLFGLMHFCAEAHSEVLALPARMKILQPLFTQIRADELQSYFLYMVRRLFPESSEADELMGAMRCFAGCEVLDSGRLERYEPSPLRITEELAFESVNAIESLIENWDSRIDFMMNYLRGDAETAATEADEFRRSESSRQERKKRDPEICHFYREWLIREFLRRLVSRFGVNSYDLLEKKRWLQPMWAAKRSPTAFYMKREMNFALGHWYRTRHKKEDREKFVEMLRGLVDTEYPRTRETVYYIIRHTSATGGKEQVSVDKEFHALLRTIYEDPQVDVPDGLGRANLPDFGNIARRRPNEERRSGSARFTRRR